MNKKRLQMQRPKSVNNDYNKGVADGWNQAFDYIENYVDPMLRNLQAVNSALATIWGIAMAGTEGGELPKEQIAIVDVALHKFLRELEISILVASQHFDTTGIIDLSPIKKFREAANRFYNGEDPDGAELRQLVAQKSRLHLDLIQLRYQPGMLSGQPKSKVIDRLCARMKRYRDMGYKLPAAYDAAINELATIEDRTPDEREEYIYTEGWSFDAAKKAFNNRYSKTINTGK